MATTTEVRALTAEHRRAQVREAAAVAATVAALYQSKVDPYALGEVEAWIDRVVPQILRASSKGARTAAQYASNLRKLEVPTGPRITFDALDGSVHAQVRRSLLYLGPEDYLNKASNINTLDVSPTQRVALLREAKQLSAKKVAASVVRHAQSGGRETLSGSVAADSTVVGWVRVTRDKPCFFCAMLASRGTVFQEDSFSDSDPRFRDAGAELGIVISNAKVHDSCQCSLKPVRNPKTDPLVEDSEKFTALWEQWGAGGTNAQGKGVDTGAMLRFRRGYEHWVKTGETLPWDIVANTEAFRSR